MRLTRNAALLPLAEAAALGPAACTPGAPAPTTTGGDPSASTPAEAVELTFWHNATTGDGKALLAPGR